MSIHSLNKVIGQQLKMGMYWEYETYWAPIKDKATGKQIMVPMKKLMLRAFDRHQNRDRAKIIDNFRMEFENCKI